MRITFGDGKYGVENNNGILTAFRHGEAWPGKTANLIGDNFVLALVQRVEDLEKELAELKVTGSAGENAYIVIYHHDFGTDVSGYRSEAEAKLGAANIAILWSHELEETDDIVEAYVAGDYDKVVELYTSRHVPAESIAVNRLSPGASVEIWTRDELEDVM